MVWKANRWSKKSNSLKNHKCSKIWNFTSLFIFLSFLFVKNFLSRCYSLKILRWAPWEWYLFVTILLAFPFINNFLIINLSKYRRNVGILVLFFKSIFQFRIIDIFFKHSLLYYIIMHWVSIKINLLHVYIQKLFFELI